VGESANIVATPSKNPRESADTLITQALRDQRQHSDGSVIVGSRVYRNSSSTRDSVAPAAGEKGPP
jgi:hypothetical protein